MGSRLTKFNEENQESKKKKNQTLGKDDFTTPISIKMLTDEWGAVMIIVATT